MPESVPASILVVDDDFHGRQLLLSILRIAGYSAHEAMNGKTALRLLKEQPVDLVLLDVLLPDMDGWQVCSRIREMSDVPIIMLTACGSSQDVVKGLELGADDYLIKPFAFNELSGSGRSTASTSNQKER